MIIALVAALFALATLVIIPGAPASKPTRLGLDLKGGIELIYQGRPTPKVPKVTPEAVANAIDTIRKRTDALGVSEPEIQKEGTDQISIGLPGVPNAARAEQQVGTTAQLQFYDWEPHVLNPGASGINTPSPLFGFFQAVSFASKKSDKPEPTDIPPDAPSKQIAARFHNNQLAIERYYDTQNDTAGAKYYLFGPNKQLIAPGQIGSTGGTSSTLAAANPATQFYESCGEIASDYEGAAPTTGARSHTGGPAAKGTACPSTMAKLARETVGPPKGSTVVKVPQGVVIVKDTAQPKAPKGTPIGFWVLEDDSELSGSDITDPKQNFDQAGAPDVTFNFTGKGRKAFSRTTKREADRGSTITIPPGGDRQSTFQHFAITLDNQLVSLAFISYIDNPTGIDGTNGAEIDNIGNIGDTQNLAQQLRIGALPIELKLISKTQVSATLGKQALHQGLIAGAVGLALTLLFLLLFYRVLGVVAGIALLIYAVLLFALVKLIPITLTLPGIAGLILTLGVAADANIVIFERVKEEARSGRSVPAAIASGYAKALKAIIDANVVTLGVAFILFMLATAGVKGFALTLLIGTLASLFTAVLATQAILSSMSRWKLMRSRWALRLGDRDRSWKFDFMGNAKWFFSMSGTIIAAGAIAIAALGINFGIDFTSGTRITTPLQRPASVGQVRSAIAPLGYGDAKIQAVQDPSLGKNVIQISTRKLEPSRVNLVENSLDKRFGVKRADFSDSSVGPTFGKEIANTAIIAVIASLILISIYIGLRFEFKFAVPVLIALAHDLLITSGVYALTSREVTTSTVAALLTILGFSLYDTIIVFDRIRENLPRMPRATFSQIVNRSMSEVLTRSLATSFSTLIPIGALMLFGGQTLKDFGFALLVGVASGAYSSIFIASPVLTHWKEREGVWRRRERIVREDHGGFIPAYAEIALGTDAPRRAPARRERVAARSQGAARSAQAARPASAPSTVVEEPPVTDGGDGRTEPPPTDGGDGRTVEKPVVPPAAPPGGGVGAPGGEAAAPGGGAKAGASRPPQSSPRQKQQKGKRRKHGRR